MSQPELTAAAAEGKGTDPFEKLRALHPGARLVLFLDRRTGSSFTMAVPPSSPWHELLPPEQIAEILPHAPRETA